MRYIEMFREGMHTSDVYLCKTKQIALTKSGKEYGNLVLQDKTGTIDGKIWIWALPVWEALRQWIIFRSRPM